MAQSLRMFPVGLYGAVLGLAGRGGAARAGAPVRGVAVFFVVVVPVETLSALFRGELFAAPRASRERAS